MPGQTALELGLAAHEKRVKDAADAGAKTRYTAPGCWRWDQGAQKTVPRSPDECRCKPTAHTSDKRMSPGTARAEFGYSYSKWTGALTLTPWKPSKAKTTDRMLENVAACESLGLSYWADGWDTNMLWAVDNEQTAHVVTIDRKKGTALHACTHTYRRWTKEVGIQGRPIPETRVFCTKIKFGAKSSTWEVGGRSLTQMLALNYEEDPDMAERPSDTYAREAVAAGRNPFLGKESATLTKMVAAEHLAVTKESVLHADAKFAADVLTTFATGQTPEPEPEMSGVVSNMVEGMSVEAAWELFVHDPTYFDDFNDDMLDRLRRKAGRSGSYFLLIRNEIKRRANAK